MVGSQLLDHVFDEEGGIGEGEGVLGGEADLELGRAILGGAGFAGDADEVEVAMEVGEEGRLGEREEQVIDLVRRRR